MRRFIVLASVVLLVLIMLGIASGVAIAQTAPFLPGSPLFPIQDFSEQFQASLQSPAERQVEAYIRLAERRIENLVMQMGSPHESESLAHLDTALDRAVSSWSQLPTEAADALRERIQFLLKASEIAAHQLIVAPSQNPGQVDAFLAKMITLQSLAESSEADPSILAGLSTSNFLSAPVGAKEQANQPDATIDPLAVPFPEGSIASQHAFFPLAGQHAQIECEACHTDGAYEGTAAYCEACHSGVKPDPHYEGNCAACHSAFSWSDITFDHSLVWSTTCISCHRDDKPANHFGNQCAACHSTNTWSGASFNHQAAGATDCKSCHSDDKPGNHFSGQCSACHSTNTWSGANFNHQAVGSTDCQTCHSDDKPANHFSGQCSTCHSTNDWDAEFSHSEQTDCKACHSGDKPANHFSGQCSACHSTNDWDAEFSHSGQTDCKACHSGDKPANHSGGQCSACHGTNDWDAEFSHSGQTDCKACHLGDRPDDHDNGQCSECHNTSDWDDADDDDDDDGDDDDDDDGDDDDDEQGNLNATFIRVAANFHATENTIIETSTPGTVTSWWQTILMIFHNIVPFSIG